MLRRLYDDVIEAEAIQSMLNKRIMAAQNTDFYRNLKSCSFKYRRASMNVVAGSRKGEGQSCWQQIYTAGCTMVAVITYCYGRFIDSIDCTDGCRPSKMYFLRTLIEKTLKDREDLLVEPNFVSNLVPPDEYVHQSCYSFSFLVTTIHETYQPRWDYLGRWFCFPIQSEGAKIL